jgi:hypothetical protein
VSECHQHYETVRAAIESMEQRQREEEERRRSDGQGAPENKAIIQPSN